MQITTANISALVPDATYNVFVKRNKRSRTMSQVAIVSGTEAARWLAAAAAPELLIFTPAS